MYSWALASKKFLAINKHFVLQVLLYEKLTYKLMVAHQ